MNKTKYRKNLEKEFVKFNEEHENILKYKEEVKNTSGIFKLSEALSYEFLTYSTGEVVKARKDMKALDKMSEKPIKAFDFDTKDGKKVNVYIPQRLQFLNEEPENK